MEFGEGLRQLRLARGLTPSQLASKSGVNTSQILRYESGERKDLYFSTLKSLAKALNVPLSYFDDYWDGTNAQKQIMSHVWEDISPEEVREIIDYMEFIHKRHEKKPFD